MQMRAPACVRSAVREIAPPPARSAVAVVGAAAFSGVVFALCADKVSNIRLQRHEPAAPLRLRQPGTDRFPAPHRHLRPPSAAPDCGGQRARYLALCRTLPSTSGDSAAKDSRGQMPTHGPPTDPQRDRSDGVRMLNRTVASCLLWRRSMF